MQSEVKLTTEMQTVSDAFQNPLVLLFSQETVEHKYGLASHVINLIGGYSHFTFFKTYRKTVVK
jgi:hypothetical protein